MREQMRITGYNTEDEVGSNHGMKADLLVLDRGTASTEMKIGQIVREFLAWDAVDFVRVERYKK